MNEDSRTAFERAAGLKDQALIDFRKAKLKLGLKDPDFAFCPECGKSVLTLVEGICIGCRELRKERYKKALKPNSEKKSSLLNKVIEAKKTEIGDTWGVGKGLPKDD